MKIMNPQGPWALGSTVLITAVLISVGTAVPVAQAIETAELGELVFDIDKPEDMREVGSRAGIQINTFMLARDYALVEFV